MKTEDVRECAVAGCESKTRFPICSGCSSRTTRALNNLPSLFDELGTPEMLARKSGRSERVSGGGEDYVLVGPASDHRAKIHDTLLASRRTLRAVLGFTPAHPQGQASQRVREAAMFLARALPQLAESPSGPEACAEIIDLEREAHAISSDTAGHDRLAAPCPMDECGQYALIRRNGESEVVCDPRRNGCGRVWSEDQYQQLVHVLAYAARDYHVTAREAVAWTGRSMRTIRRWIEDGKMTVVSSDDEGRFYYLLGDVLDADKAATHTSVRRGA